MTVARAPTSGPTMRHARRPMSTAQSLWVLKISLTKNSTSVHLSCCPQCRLALLRSLKQAWSTAEEGFAELRDGPALSSASVLQSCDRLQQVTREQFEDETRSLTMKVVDQARPRLVARMAKHRADLEKRHALQRALLNLEVR